MTDSALLFGRKFKRGGYRIGRLDGGIKGVNTEFNTGQLETGDIPTVRGLATKVMAANGVDPSDWGRRSRPRAQGGAAVRRGRMALVMVAALGAAGALLAHHLDLADGDEPAPAAIEPAQCARKMALDLTRRGPTEAELAGLADGSLTLADLADIYLASSELEATVFDWYRAKFPPTQWTAPEIDVEEPARIARQIVVDDRDARELLTGDFTVDADGALVARPDAPAAGVLPTRHYMSAYLGSLRRGWAAHS